VWLLAILKLLLSPTITAHDMPEDDEFIPGSPSSAPLSRELHTLLHTMKVSVLRGAFSVWPASVSVNVVRVLMQAHEFIARDGVKIDELVDLPSETSASAALEEMNKHNLTAVPVFRNEVVALPGIVGGAMPAYVPTTEKVPVSLLQWPLPWCDLVVSLLLSEVHRLGGFRYIVWHARFLRVPLLCRCVICLFVCASCRAADLVSLMLEQGLRERRGGVLSALSSLFTSDDAHSAQAAVNYSNNDPFWAIPINRGMEQVVRVMGVNRIHRIAVVDVDDGNRVRQSRSSLFVLLLLVLVLLWSVPGGWHHHPVCCCAVLRGTS
jgi:CBS domain-containing protein